MLYGNPSSLPPLPHLERYPEQGGPAERVVLAPLPLTVGRTEEADHTIYSSAISKRHAVFVRIGERYAVRDLQSTNGTFVNGQRVVEQVLEDGDIIHFAHVEFCFRHPHRLVPMATASDNQSESTQALPLAEPLSLIRGTELLRDLVRTEAVEILYQPIVDLRTAEVIGYEALGRGTHPDLSRSPSVLLGLAEQCGLSIELSQLFRRLAVRASAQLPGTTRLFLNIHPRELGDEGLLASLELLRGMQDSHPVVLEIPESAVTDVHMLATLQTSLTALGVECAYDDFGAGQTRLLELTEVPPHYLKIDKTFIYGIDTAKPRQEMVAAIVRVAETLGVQVIAEGIESVEATEVCRHLGCKLGQGYLFSGPENLAREIVPVPRQSSRRRPAPRPKPPSSPAARRRKKARRSS